MLQPGAKDVMTKSKIWSIYSEGVRRHTTYVCNLSMFSPTWMEVHYPNNGSRTLCSNKKECRGRDSLVELALTEQWNLWGEPWHLAHVLRNILLDVSSWRDGGDVVRNLSATGESSDSIRSTALVFRLAADESLDATTARMGAASVLRGADGTWRSSISESRDCGSGFLVCTTNCLHVARVLGARLR